MISFRRWNFDKVSAVLGMILLAMAAYTYFVDEESPATLLVLGICNLALGVGGLWKKEREEQSTDAAS